jgi:hypothetical protein
MATTTNFGWETPDDTDLVKDGAAAIRTLGQAIDTSMADLEGGTTGQVLSKASNTDMDFTWVTTDDANAIQNSIVDAKGDLIAATANDTPARLAVGANDTILTADSTAATGMKWAAPAAAGGWTSLATGSLSGTSTTVSITTTGYKQLVCFVKDVVCTTDWYWKIQLNSDTGSNYSQINQYNNTASAVTTTNFVDSGFVSYGTVEATDKNAFGVWTIYDPANTNTVKTCTGYLSAMDYQDTFRSNGIVTGQWFASPAAITGVTFVAVSTYSSGTYEIYGVK